MYFDDDMPARCWMAPLMPQAMYSVGETVLPVWPTWYWWSTQPASTTARDAPTAAPMAAARLSTRWKFSGPFNPRPPDTMIWASVSSSLPAAVAWRAATFARAVVGLGGVGGQLGLVEEVDHVGAVGAQVPDEGLPLRADDDGLHGGLQGLGQALGRRDGLQGRTAQPAVPMLGIGDDRGHQMTLASS